MVSVIRIGNVSIPGNKAIGIGLSRIYGIGKKFRRPKSLAQQIFQKTKVNPLMKAKNLDDEQIKLISQEIKEYSNEGDLKKKVKQDIEKKVRINCRQGKLHSMNKKVRGQPTRHNNRTRPNGIVSMTKTRITVAGKKKAPKQG